MKLITIILILISYSVFGQSSEIISIKKDYPNPSRMLLFNYVTQEFDTIYYFDKHIVVTNSTCVFDSYRSIFYYYISNLYIKAVDLISQEHYTVCSLPRSIIDMQYDPFDNSLILRESDTLRKYLVNSDEFLTICPLPYSNSMSFSSLPHAYNFMDKEYLYQAESYSGYPSEYSYVLIDVETQNIINISEIPLVSGTSLPYLAHYIKYDYITNSYLGMSRDSINYQDDYFVTIDPVNVSYEYISPAPSAYWGSFNQSKAVFDPYNRVYLKPYVNEAFDSVKIAKVNIETGELETLNYQIYTDNQELNRSPKLLSKFENNYLIANQMNNYTWFINDSIIPGENSQILYPLISGYYKVSSEITFGDTLYSDELYVNLTSTEHNNFAEIYDIKLNPNPITGISKIKIDMRIIGLKFITIYDSMGKIVKSIKTDENLISLDKSDFISGEYIYNIFQVNKSLYTGKFIVE